MRVSEASEHLEMLFYIGLCVGGRVHTESIQTDVNRQNIILKMARASVLIPN